MSATYIQVHFRLDITMEASTMNPDQTPSDLGSDCLQLHKQMAKVVIGREKG